MSEPTLTPEEEAALNQALRKQLRPYSDTARLDWLERNCNTVDPTLGGEPPWQWGVNGNEPFFPTIREAIDYAMLHESDS